MDYTSFFEDIYKASELAKIEEQEAPKIYDNYQDLMAAKGIASYDKEWTDSKGNVRTYKAYDCPENYFDYNIKPLKCIDKVEFNADEEGRVECVTAAECEYHGKNIVVVLPVASEASYVETSYTKPTHWDPGDSEGYFEISEDVEVSDSFGAIFSSVKKYREVCEEYKKNRRELAKQKIYLGKFLEMHSDADITYTIDNDGLRESPLSGVAESFYDEYLDIVNKGFETSIGDDYVINSYHRKMQDLEDKADEHYHSEN